MARKCRALVSCRGDWSGYLGPMGAPMERTRPSPRSAAQCPRRFIQHDIEEMARLRFRSADKRFPADTYPIEPHV
jgi:hypothetical protein